MEDFFAGAVVVGEDPRKEEANGRRRTGSCRRPADHGRGDLLSSPTEWDGGWEHCSQCATHCSAYGASSPTHANRAPPCEPTVVSLSISSIRARKLGENNPTIWINPWLVYVGLIVCVTWRRDALWTKPMRSSARRSRVALQWWRLLVVRGVLDGPSSPWCLPHDPAANNTRISPFFNPISIKQSNWHHCKCI